MDVPREIVCVDCGGRCHLLGHPPTEGFQAGDVVAYRCEDCLDRWDLVLPTDEEAASEKWGEQGEYAPPNGGHAP